MKFPLHFVLGVAAFVSLGTSFAQRTFVVQNNFDSGTPNAAEYFGSNYGNSQVWLMWENSGGFISYTGTNGAVTVSDGTAIQLSTVQNGSFSVSTGATATRVYAALSSSGANPYTTAPDPFSVNPPSNYAYALAEFTYQGNSFDTADTSYEDTFAFPTKLTTSSSGNPVNSSGWKAGTQAQQVVTALAQVMPNTATAKIPTTSSSSDPSADRYVGTSLHYQTGVDFQANPNATVSYSGPGYDSYLGYLQASAPTVANPNDPNNPAANITGWYLDYSGNNGYSGYLQVTGSSGNYGITISNIRANTESLGGQNTNTEAGRALGTSINGTIVISANGEELTLDASPDYTFTGPWTDMVISSGDQLYTNNPSQFAAGPVVTATGDLNPVDGAYNSLASTFLATVSSIMVTGLLGSETFEANPSSNYWFGTDGVDVNTALFSSLWSNLPEGTFYWDPYVATLVSYNEWEGYSFPFQDRFEGLPSTALNISAIDTMTWELGIPVPEPSSIFLLVSGLTLLGAISRRRRP